MEYKQTRILMFLITIRLGQDLKMKESEGNWESTYLKMILKMNEE